MGRTIAITNQKGGVGKTTTAINLSAALAEAGQRVLLIDFDPQGNTGSGLGAEIKKGNTVYDLICGNAEFKDCVIRESVENLDLIPSDMNLAGAEAEFQDIEHMESKLSEAIKGEKDNYDYIIIDCPPSLSVLTINALTASDTAFRPQINNMIGNLYEIKIVLNYKNSISLISKLLENFYKFVQIVPVKSDRRFIQEIESFSR